LNGYLFARLDATDYFDGLAQPLVTVQTEKDAIIAERKKAVPQIIRVKKALLANPISQADILGDKSLANKEDMEAQYNKLKAILVPTTKAKDPIYDTPLDEAIKGELTWNSVEFGTCPKSVKCN
jgi:hypothetical protein